MPPNRFIPLELENSVLHWNFAFLPVISVGYVRCFWFVVIAGKTQTDESKCVSTNLTLGVSVNMPEVRLVIIWTENMYVSGLEML